MEAESVEACFTFDRRVYPVPSRRNRRLTAVGAASGLFAVESRGGELNRLLNQISSLSERTSLTEADWGSLRQLVARAVEQAGEQADADQELRQMALTDELTGLYNRRGFLVLALHQLKLCRRNSQPAIIFFADVDGLKHVNDIHGHACGDELLVRCSAVLRATFRDSDIIARLDGDEFAIFAAEQQDLSQESVCTRLNAHIADQNAIGGQVPLSVSVGAARFDPNRPYSLAELLMAADRAMYCEKRHRRASRAVFAGDTASG